MGLHYNQIAGRSVERLGGLADGVFAFAMTLLVLDLRVPIADTIHSERNLWNALAALEPNLLTYLLSFMILGIFWVGEHTQLSKLKHSDRNLTWLHLALLLSVTFLPFSTKLLAAFITYRTGLIKDGAPAGLYAAIMRRLLVSQSLYALGAALCVVNTYVSIGFIILVQLNFVFAPRWGVLRKF